MQEGHLQGRLNIRAPQADYPDNSSIYNKGDVGLISLLHTLYGGEDGWIMMAKDINEKSAVEIVKW